MVWFKKQECRLNEPSSFVIPPVFIYNKVNQEIGDFAYWHGYDIMCNVSVESNAIKGDILVTFLEINDEVVPVFVLLIYTVTINGDEYRPFQQFTRDTLNIVWCEEQLIEEKNDQQKWC